MNWTTFVVLAMPVSPEEGGGGFSFTMVLAMFAACAISMWGSEQAWERWRVDVPGITRRFAPYLLCLGLGMMLRPYLSGAGGWLCFALMMVGFFGLMLEGRGEG